MPVLPATRQAILIVGTGEAARKYFEISEKLKLLTVGVDRNSLNSRADFHVAQSTYEVDRVEKACRSLAESERLQVVGVLSRSSGPAVITVSRLAQSFGVRGVSEGLARACVSKKELARQAELLSIPSPRRLNDAAEIVAALRRGRRVVIKPDIPIIGKKGVLVVSTAKEMNRAFSVAAANSYNSEAIAQEYSPGKDIFLVAFVRQAQIIWRTFFEERVGFAAGEFYNQGLVWGQKIEVGVAEAMERTSRSFVKAHPCSGTVVFSYRASGSSALLYEVNTGLVGDGLFDSLWSKVWPSDNPFLREAMEMIGRDVIFPNSAGTPADYHPKEG